MKTPNRLDLLLLVVFAVTCSVLLTGAYWLGALTTSTSSQKSTVSSLTCKHALRKFTPQSDPHGTDEQSTSMMLRTQLQAAHDRMRALYGQVAAVNASSASLLDFVKDLAANANKIMKSLDRKLPHQTSGDEPVPLANVLRPGEIRHRGMIGNDCLSPLDNRRIISYPCHGGNDQVWRWDADGRLVAFRHECLDITDLQIGDEIRTRPCRFANRFNF